MILAMMLTVFAAPEDRAAAAYAEAEALIAAAGAEGLFQNVTTDVTPTLRHTASGLICHFTPGEPTNRVTIYPAMGGLARGEDVSCGTRASRMTATVYATRYAGRLSETQDLEMSARTLRARHDVQPYEGGFPLLTAPTRDTPPPHAAFTGQGEEGPFVTFVLIQHHGEWGYKFRGTQNTDDVVRAGMTGGLMFMNALSAVGDQD